MLSKSEDLNTQDIELSTADFYTEMLYDPTTGKVAIIMNGVIIVDDSFNYQCILDEDEDTEWSRLERKKAQEWNDSGILAHILNLDNYQILTVPESNGLDGGDLRSLVLDTENIKVLPEIIDFGIHPTALWSALEDTIW